MCAHFIPKKEIINFHNAPSNDFHVTCIVTYDISKNEYVNPILIIIAMPSRCLVRV